MTDDLNKQDYDFDLAEGTCRPGKLYLVIRGGSAGVKCYRKNRLFVVTDVIATKIASDRVIVPTASVVMFTKVEEKEIGLFISLLHAGELLHCAVYKSWFAKTFMSVSAIKGKQQAD